MYRTKKLVPFGTYEPVEG